MKITLAVRYFQRVGGMEKFSLTLADFLVKRGHKVRVVAIWGQPMDGVDLQLLSPPRFMPRAMRDWLTGKRLAEALNHDDADLTYGEQKMWNCDIIRPAGGVEDEYWKMHVKYSRKPIHLPAWTRRLAIKRLFDIKAEREGFANPKLRRLIVNSDIVRNQLLLHYPQLDNRITVVHEGIVFKTGSDPQDSAAARKRLLSGHNLDPNHATAIFVGHDFRRKGLRQAIQALAAARAADPTFNLQLVVLGRDRAASFRKLADSLGVGKVVAFAGSVSPSDAYLQAADVLLFPSFYDPFANVTIEAMAAGLPVITTRQNGGHEVITHGENGWIISHPDDIPAMAAALLELRKRDKLQSMRSLAVQAANRHSLSDKLMQIENVFLSVVEEKKKSASHKPR